MTDVELREMECALVLGEELHFGRTAERLGLSQGRVSQLVRLLERRIGGPLFERTSRRVQPTRLGREFLDNLRPAYDAMRDAVCVARASARGVGGTLRLGFSGLFDEYIASLITRFERRHQDSEAVFCEFPLNDPFGPVRRGAVDAIIAFGEVREPDLVIGASFPAHPQSVLVSARHPFARRGSISVEELANEAMIDYAGSAPAYWRESVAPTVTPNGRTIPRGPTITTIQEGILAVAADRGVLLSCQPTAERLHRPDIAAVLVHDLPRSARSLVWTKGSETPLLRSFAELAQSLDHPSASTETATSGSAAADPTVGGRSPGTPHASATPARGAPGRGAPAAAPR